MDILADIDVRHLRRIRRIPESPDGPFINEVVLCGAQSISRQELAALIWKHCDEVPPLRPTLALASKWAPYTREQYRSFSNIWPVKIRREAKKFSLFFQRIIDLQENQKLLLDRDFRDETVYA